MHTRSGCRPGDDFCTLEHKLDECHTLRGILIIAFCAIALLLIRFQTEQPWELLGMVVSILCVACAVYGNPTESFAILFLILVLSYFVISISNTLGTGIQIFFSTFILALLLLMFVVSCTRSTLSYLLVIAMIIDAIFLYRLLSEEYGC